MSAKQHLRVHSGPQRTQQITGRAFRISFHLDWQIDDGIYNRPIIAHTRILVQRWRPRTMISALFRRRTFHLWYRLKTSRLWCQNCKFFTTLLYCNSQKRLEHKENQTKYRKQTRKPQSHIRILIYQMWVGCSFLPHNVFLLVVDYIVQFSSHWDHQILYKPLLVNFTPLDANQFTGGCFFRFLMYEFFRFYLRLICSCIFASLC